MKRISNLLISKIWRNSIINLVLISLIGLQGCIPKDTQNYRVGIICSANSVVTTIDGFKAKMEKLGYHEDKNIFYDIQIVKADPDEQTRIIEQFVNQKVDLIFAFPHDAAQVAKNKTQGTNIPVIFAYTAINEADFVNSLREPGGNVTGIQHQLEKLTVKRFELLLEFDPTIKRIWTAYAVNSSLDFTLQALRKAAQSKNITLLEVPINNLEEMQADLENREKSADLGIDAILLLPDQITQSSPAWNVINTYAKTHNIPVSAYVVSQLKDGALFHYGNDYTEVGEKAATLADKILQGVSPSELPVLSPEEYLRINMVTAKTLELSVPDGLLKQAVEINH